MPVRTLHRLVLGLLFVSILAARSSQAVIVYGAHGDAASNTTAPPDDPGWDYVAAVNPSDPSTAIYLGNYGGNFWMLTANHAILGSTLALGGVTYGIVDDSSIQIGSADLKVFQIDADPGLPQLTLATTAPPLDAPVVMIGNGRGKAAINEVDAPDIYTRTWDIEEVVGPDVWTSPGAEAAGYVWNNATSSSVLRWGTNTIDAISVSVSGTLSAVTTFNDTSNPDEAQGALGDSGGAVFHKNGLTWELTAVIFAVGAYNGSTLSYAFDNQPGSTSIYQYPTDPDAGSTTYAAQISVYRNEILAAVPEPSAALLVSLSVLALASRRQARSRADGSESKSFASPIAP